MVDLFTREECVNVHWFASLDDAPQKIDGFRSDQCAPSSPSSQGSQPSGTQRACACSSAPSRRGGERSLSFVSAFAAGCKEQDACASVEACGAASSAGHGSCFPSTSDGLERTPVKMPTCLAAVDMSLSKENEMTTRRLTAALAVAIIVWTASPIIVWTASPALAQDTGKTEAAKLASESRAALQNPPSRL